MSDRRSERLRGTPEKRRQAGLATFEIRSDTETAMVLDGHASVFDSWYDVYGGPDAGGWKESVDKRAFDRTLSATPDVHLLVNHDGLPLANTIAGDLQLDTDKRGLRSVADLDPTDRDVQHIAPKIRRRNLREMSFAFRVPKGGDEWNKAETERRILEVNIDHGDVSIVNFGANPATSVTLRHFADAIAVLSDVDPDAALAELRSFDLPADALAQAYSALGTLLRKATPAAKRCLSVLEAEAVLTTPR